jgi:RNase P subunit RPR2
MARKRRLCRSCGEPLTIENKLEDHLGSNIDVCLSCIGAAVKAIKKEDERHYYGLEPEIDV